MNAVVSLTPNTRPVSHHSKSFRSDSSHNPSVKLSNQVIAPARNRKGTSAGLWRGKNKQDNRLVAACMPVLAKPAQVNRQTDPNYRKRLVTKAHGLPQDLISDDSAILKGIDDLDFAILHGKAPKPAGIQAVAQIRAAIKKSCGNYMPVSVSSMASTGVDPTLPFLADGKGVLCASGTAGYKNFRGVLCTKVCRVSMSETDLADTPSILKEYSFLSMSDFMSGIREAQGIVASSI